MSKSFISLGELTLYEFYALLDLAQDLQKKPERFRKRLVDRSLALFFTRVSSHTKAAFELGVRQMGGTSVCLDTAELEQLPRDTDQDFLKSLDNWVDGVALYGLPHSQVLSLSENSRIPLLNAGSDRVAPVQALTDMFTIRQFRRNLADSHLAFIGVGSPVCHSLLLAGAKAGITMAVATPPGMGPDPVIIRKAESDGQETGFRLILTDDPREAVSNADVVYTSNWLPRASQALSAYQVTGSLLAHASPEVMFMHPQSMYRGKEVEADVVESSASVIFKQAENKLHIQKAIMVLYLVENYNYNE